MFDFPLLFFPIITVLQGSNAKIPGVADRKLHASFSVKFNIFMIFFSLANNHSEEEK